VPLLQDHTLVIGESAAIIAYLAKTYPDQAASLIPKDSETYAKWLEWCFFIVTELDSTSLYVMRRHGQIKGLSHIYGDAPGVVAQAAEYFRKQLKHVDAALSDGREYLLGEQFTTADILLTTCLTWAIDYQVAICDSATPYLDRVLNRPAYRDASAANKPG
jgi:glutathione S-transferase